MLGCRKLRLLVINYGKKIMVLYLLLLRKELNEVLDNCNGICDIIML